LIKLPKYTKGQKVLVRHWTGEKSTGTIVDAIWMYHKRLRKHTWGYRVLFDGCKTPDDTLFPEGYLENFNVLNEQLENQEVVKTDIPIDQLLFLHSFEQKLSNPQSEKIKNELKKLGTLEEIVIEIHKTIDQLVEKETSYPIAKHKLLGDRWAEVYIKTIIPKIMTSNGLLRPVTFTELHKTILPANYIWAGISRSSNFAINGTFGNFETDIGVTNYKIMPISHSEINEKLIELCRDWNRYLDTSDCHSLHEKINTIARFHYRFLIIYPFWVANESVSWVLLSNMVNHLLRTKVKPIHDENDDRWDYYSSIRFAHQMNDFIPLSDYITNHLFLDQ